MFFEKGFDNVYLLTGGLEEFHSHCPSYVEGSNIPEPIPIEKKTQERKKIIMKGRQPTYTKGKPISKVNSGTVYSRKNQAPSKVGVKNKRTSKLANAGQRLVGNHKQQFEDIPDSISTFSKITGSRSNYTNKRASPVEKELTAKPNQIIMNGQGNLATIKEDHFTGKRQAKEVTGKPNNIRAPIGFAAGARF